MFKIGDTVRLPTSHKADSCRRFWRPLRFERELIRERTGEGRKRERRQVRPQAQESDYQRTEAMKRRAAGETLTDIAKSYGVAISMISRL